MINTDALKSITEESVREAIVTMNNQPYMKEAGKIQGKRHGKKIDFATALVEKVLVLSDKGFKIPEDVDVLVGKIHTIFMDDLKRVAESTVVPVEVLAKVQEKKPITEDPNFMDEMFEFLDNLRESGVTNMFGAGPYLTKEFGLGKKLAREILKRWMETFSKRHPAPEPDMPIPQVLAATKVHPVVEPVVEPKPKKVKKPAVDKKPTKKSIIIKMVSELKGASVEQMAQACTDAGLGDMELNRKIVRVWLSKLGFKVQKDADGMYTKV